MKKSFQSACVYLWCISTALSAEGGRINAWEIDSPPKIDFRKIQELEKKYELLEIENQFQFFRAMNNPGTQLELLAASMLLDNRVRSSSGPRDPRYFYSAGRLSYLLGEKEKAAQGFLNGTLFATLEATRCADYTAAVEYLQGMEKEFSPLQQLYWSLPKQTRELLIHLTLELESKRKLRAPTDWLCKGGISSLKAAIEGQLKAQGESPDREESTTEKTYVPDDVYLSFRPSVVLEFKKRFLRDSQ